MTLFVAELVLSLVQKAATSGKLGNLDMVVGLLKDIIPVNNIAMSLRSSLGLLDGLPSLGSVAIDTAAAVRRLLDMQLTDIPQAQVHPAILELSNTSAALPQQRPDQDYMCPNQRLAMICGTNRYDDPCNTLGLADPVLYPYIQIRECPTSYRCFVDVCFEYAYDYGTCFEAARCIPDYTPPESPSPSPQPPADPDGGVQRLIDDIKNIIRAQLMPGLDAIAAMQSALQEAKASVPVKGVTPEVCAVFQSELC